MAPGKTTTNHDKMRIGKLFRQTGKAVLKAQREASRLNEGLDDILGENRTKPSDGFNKDRTRKRASLGTNRKNRMRNKLRDTSKGTEKNFNLEFGKNQEKEDEENRFF